MSTGRSSSRSSISSCSRSTRAVSLYCSACAAGERPKPGPSTASTWKPAPASTGATSRSSAPDWPSPSACQKTSGTSSRLPHSWTCMRRPYARRRALRPTYRKPGSGCAVGVELFRGDLLADLLERAPDQTRHVHLRDPDLLRDLRLRQPFEEAQVQDLALALVEDAEARREHGAILGHLVLVLVAADRLERVELLAVLLRAAARKRQGRVRAA